jgi:hypothetical protein
MHFNRKWFIDQWFSIGIAYTWYERGNALSWENMKQNKPSNGLLKYKKGPKGFYEIN